MTHEKARRVSIILTALGLVLMFLLYVLVDVAVAFTVVIILAFGLMCSAIVIWVKFYRCPYCQCLLSDRGGAPSFCPHCGGEL